MLVFVPFLLLEIGNRNGSTGLMFCLNPPEGFLGLKGTKSTSRCRRASDLGLRFVGDAGGQDKEAAANKGEVSCELRCGNRSKIEQPQSLQCN